MASSTTRQTLDEAYPGLSSEDAIADAADDGRSINKYADPIEGARFGLTAEEADEVAASDPSLLWVEECDDDDDSSFATTRCSRSTTWLTRSSLGVPR